MLRGSPPSLETFSPTWLIDEFPRLNEFLRNSNLNDIREFIILMGMLPLTNGF